MFESNTTEVEDNKVYTYYNIEVLRGEILATPEFDPEAVGQVRPKLIQANLFIESLNKSLASHAEMYNSMRSKHFAKIAELGDFLKENAEDMDDRHVREIAEIFDIELKKTIEFKATIEVQGEIEVDIWTKEADYFDDVDFDVTLDYHTEGSISSTEIKEIDEWN